MIVILLLANSRSKLNNYSKSFATIASRQSQISSLTFPQRARRKKTPQKESLVCPGIVVIRGLINYSWKSGGRVPCRSRSIAWVGISICSTRCNRDYAVATVAPRQLRPTRQPRGIIDLDDFNCQCNPH